MKKTLMVPILFSFLFLTSCVPLSIYSNSSTSDNTSGTNTEQSFFHIHNESVFKVNVYSDSFREKLVCTLDKNETKTIESDSADRECIYYLTYLVDLGVEIPWDDTDSFIVAYPDKDYTIKTPLSMGTNSCFLIIENSSSEQIILKRGSSELIPENDKSKTILSKGENGVYRITKSSFGNFDSFKIITLKNKEISLPENFTSFESGMIVTILVADENSGYQSANIKTITPFNIDTQKQIWSFDNNTFNSNFPIVMRPSFNISDGSFVMGTISGSSTEIGLMEIDKYNSQNILHTAQIKHSNLVMTNKSSIIDFAVQKDGSTVILIQNEYTEEDEKRVVQLIVCYDFENKTLRWSYIFPDIMIFRTDSKNKIISLDTDKIALAGAIIKDSSMHKYFALFTKNGNDINITQYISPDYTDIESGIETMFTSAWSDGNNFYVAGYDNCDFNYSERTHKGIIWKFNDTLTDAEEIYSCNKVLFFCIDGIKGKWFASGEYCDNGKILKGCYISQAMAENDEDPIKYSIKSADRAYCVFTQMCCYENKIIVAGISSDDFYSTKDVLPIIVAFDLQSNKALWENTSFSFYREICSIIPNGIDTYMVQLRSGTRTHYVSANLFGNEE